MPETAALYFENEETQKEFLRNLTALGISAPLQNEKFCVDVFDYAVNSLSGDTKTFLNELKRNSSQFFSSEEIISNEEFKSENFFDLWREDFLKFAKHWARTGKNEIKLIYQLERGDRLYIESEIIFDYSVNAEENEIYSYTDWDGNSAAVFQQVFIRRRDGTSKTIIN